MRPGILSLKKTLLKSVELNVFPSISPAKALTILKDLEYYFPSREKSRVKFIHYKIKGLRK
jgi:hypothetical protein